MKKQDRCPNSHFLFPAYIDGYQFQYDGYSRIREGAVANIVKKDKAIVWGGVYEINEADLKNLDRREGYPSSYDRALLEVKDEESLPHKALVYFRTGKKIGLPTIAYRDIILEGADNCGLPEEYKNQLIEISSNL